MLNIDKISIQATSTEVATGTITYTYTAEVPFFYFIMVLGIFFAAFALFRFSFKDIWD